ncbi:sensor domain-containing diguanylate cyclase [Vibrio sp. SCSIO 43137]|uniref:sensor domain-containing diguanylate cyclase n=1 Tax=Vibrio sp. SCSIO 43137 TaxID=3021011 RepID=UPI0023075B49|nr:diguanylate cyclase [Vibrio sp. SCSIO 43137]WCE31542.1 diguanylate cyclase [Vibrio sp. SCSIO 43137]
MSSRWKTCETRTPHDILDACLLQNLPDAIFLIDPETSNILFVNKAGCESLKMEEEEVLNRSVLSLQEDVINLPQWSEISQVIKQAHQPYLFIGRHKRSDGSVFPVEVRTSYFNCTGEGYFLSVARDITSRVVIDNELKDHKHSLWYALNEATDGVWQWSIQSGELYVSPKLKQMRGFGPEEVVKDVSFWADAIHKDDAERVMANLNDHLAGNLDRYEAIYRLRNRAGHYIWVHDRGKVSEYKKDGTPLVAVGMVQNVTDQVKLQERLESQAATDELTGAFNRRVAKESIDEQLRTARLNGTGFAVLLLDIDYFKKVNDEHGHSAGDEVLKAFVNNIQKNLRADDLLFRWGGEEFLVMLPGLNEETAMVVAENLRQTINQNRIMLTENSCVCLTVSMGIALYPNHAATRQRLIQNADIAMYRAKTNGRNRIERYSES